MAEVNKFFKDPYTEHTEYRKPDQQNPISANPEKYAQAKGTLLRDSFFKQFKLQLQTIETNAINKLAHTTERETHESTDYLVGQLNTARSLLNEYEGIENRGTMAEKIIVERENKKNRERQSSD
ncbi:MAG TPA: hypothetical protein VLB82_06550 [Thermodesulfobacteriota bacterium]|nr:hypothetical protein [Thermodesulfobacteriota bacterium]